MMAMLIAGRVLLCVVVVGPGGCMPSLFFYPKYVGRQW